MVETPVKKPSIKQRYNLGLEKDMLSELGLELAEKGEVNISRLFQSGFNTRPSAMGMYTRTQLPPDSNEAKILKKYGKGNTSFIGDKNIPQVMYFADRFKNDAENIEILNHELRHAALDYLKKLYPESPDNKLKLKMGVPFEEALMDYIDFVRHQKAKKMFNEEGYQNITDSKQFNRYEKVMKKLTSEDKNKLKNNYNLLSKLAEQELRNVKGVQKAEYEDEEELRDASKEDLAPKSFIEKMLGLFKRTQKFNTGGVSMEKQMEMFQDGGLEQDGGTVDPVSGNDVPMGSAQKEVRDDIPAQLSEGEFVFPADVVRFIGLERLMEIRQRAKAGLKKMEAMGQMGNSEEATIPDDIPFTIDDLEMEEEEEVSAYKGGTIKLESGGTPYVAPTIAAVPTATAPETIPTPEEFIPSVADEYREYVNDEGHVIDVPYFRGSILPGYNMPAGYRLKEDETVSTGQDITDTAMLDIVDKDGDSTSPENMQKAREDMNRSYDNVVSQVMQDNPGASLEEITKKIKGGESTINIFGKKINAPGFLFNEDEITAAYDRAFSGPVIDDEADIVPEEPKRRGTLIATDKEGKVTDDVAPGSAKSLNMTESENKAVKEAAEAKEKKRRAVETARLEAMAEAEQSRKDEAEANRAERAGTTSLGKKVDTASLRGTGRRGGQGIVRAKGGIASKPKKKKAMKRGGLASKK